MLVGMDVRAIRTCCSWLIAACLAFSVGSAIAAPSDVRLLVDVSGSMKQNDPSNLRVPAVQLLAQLIPSGSQAGFWTFGNQPYTLMAHGMVSEAWRKAAVQSADRITSSDQWTDIAAALKQAAAAKTQGSIPQHIILLSDGMVDLDQDKARNATSRNEIVDSILPQLAKAGFHVHTIALSDQADKELLSLLAKRTGGMFAEARSADDLARIFARILETAAPAEQLPLVGNTFDVDRTIQEFTLLAFRVPTSPALTLTTPDKKTYTMSQHDPNVRWYHDQGYDIVTVRKPEEGKWSLKADVDPQNRVTIVSDFNLNVEPLPASAYLGEKLDLKFSFQEKGKNIVIPAFHQIMENSLRVLFPDSQLQIYKIGTEYLQLPEGVYDKPLDMLTQPGQYELKVVVDGKTFRRLVSMPITIHAPLELKGKADTTDGNAKIVVEARPDTDALKPEASQVKVIMTDKDNKQTSANMVWMPEEKRWVAELKPEQQGDVTIKAEVNGQLQDGKAISFSPPPVEVNFSVENAPKVEKANIETQVASGMAIEQPMVASPSPAAAEKEVSDPSGVKITNEKGEEVKAPEQPPEPPATIEEEQGTNWILIGSIVGINLFLIAGGILAFRALMKRKKAKDAAEDQQVV